MLRKILELFTRRERWALAGMCAVMVLVALVQTVGVASIMPFMSLVANPEMLVENEQIRWLYELMGFQSTRAFLVFAGLVVLGIMAFSNASTAFEHWLILRFTWRQQHRLSVRLLGKYLDEPYTFYLNQNTASLAENLLIEIREFVAGVLMPAMKILAQVLVIVFVFALLVMVDVRLALAAAGMLGGGYAAIYSLVRRRQARLGKVRRTMNTRRFKAAAEALGGIKEIRVLGREHEFLRRFSTADRRYSNANASNAMVREIPRYALETLAFGGILVTMLYILYSREDFGQAVAVMSLFALAGYRLMPALQHVFRSLAQIRFFLPALSTLHADLMGGAPRAGRARAVAASAASSLRFERAIVLDGISYRYPGEEADVIKNITLVIKKNTWVAFVGGTGSGKTTLVDVLLGLLEAQQGSIRIDDVVLTPENIADWQEHVGYVPQHIYLSDDSLTRNIAFGVPDEEIDHEAVEHAARAAQLDEFIGTLVDGYETIVGERGVRLSGGQRQRIGIARALYRDPDVLIMDEATNALDGITEDALIQAIRDLSGHKTVILVAHRLTTVRECDAIYLFDRSEIVASGTYRQLMQANLMFQAMAAGRIETAAVS